MPRIKSAKKRVEVAERNRLRNRFWKSSVRTVRTRVVDSVVDPKADSDPVKALSEAFSVIDKAVSKGIMHRNTAARRKSRLSALLVNQDKAQPKVAKKKSKAS